MSGCSKLNTLVHIFVVAVLLLGLQFVCAQAATVTVHQGESIQKAIDFAKPSDVIEVLNGTYYENLNVTKRLFLRGIDYPVVNASRNGNAIKLSADGNALDGFILTNSGYNDAGICVESSYNIIRYNKVNNNNYGIALINCSSNTITSNNASNNIWGIFLKHSSNSILTNNIANNNSNGIFLTYSSNNIIVDNNANKNGEGIGLGYSGNNIVTGNIANNNNFGIYLQYSSDNTLTYNNASCDIWSTEIHESSNNLLSQNTIVGNAPFDNSINHWDNGTIGNYYSDFNCTDAKGNGICDSSYSIPGGPSIDRHPMVMRPSNRANARFGDAS